jgi:hypothetical protein
MTNAKHAFCDYAKAPETRLKIRFLQNRAGCTFRNDGSSLQRHMESQPGRLQSRRNASQTPSCPSHFHYLQSQYY